MSKLVTKIHFVTLDISRFFCFLNSIEINRIIPIAWNTSWLTVTPNTPNNGLPKTAILAKLLILTLRPIEEMKYPKENANPHMQIREGI